MIFERFYIINAIGYVLGNAAMLEDVARSAWNSTYEKGLVDSPEPKNPSTDGNDARVLRNGKDAYDSWGGNSRSRADRLRDLGWKKAEPTGVLSSIPEEVDLVLGL